MKKLLITVLFLFVSTCASAQETIWNFVKPESAEEVFAFMKTQIAAPDELPMPKIMYAQTTRSDVMMQYYNVGKTYGDNMPWIQYYKNVKREHKDMIMFYLAHEFAHYLFHAKQNQYLYPRAGNQYWELVQFNHHCDPQFIKLLDNTADFMAASNLTKRAAEMKSNTRYNCKVAGNE